MHAYSYGTPIRVWDITLSHTRTGYPIRVWDVPYAYGPIYAYGAEQPHQRLTNQRNNTREVTYLSHVKIQSPEANQPKKQHRGGDVSVACKNTIDDDNECSIQCQWCQLWAHSKCIKLNDEECAILLKCSTNIVFFCSNCAPNLDEALKLFDDNKNIPPKLNLKDDDLPDKQNKFDNQLSLLETKLNEFKEVLSLQLLKCREMFSSPTTISTNPPPLIANTVVTALNEEREKR